MVTNLHNILIIRLHTSIIHLLTPLHPRIHQISNLHFQILDQVTEISLLPLISEPLPSQLLRLVAPHRQHLIARLLIDAHNNGFQVDAFFN